MPLLPFARPAYISPLTTKEGAMREQINSDLKEAMKAGEKHRVGTLRLINAATPGVINPKTGWRRSGPGCAR